MAPNTDAQLIPTISPYDIPVQSTKLQESIAAAPTTMWQYNSTLQCTVGDYEVANIILRS